MKCDLCDYTHSRKSFVRTHFNRVHQKIKHLVCDKCEYATVNERSLFFHKKSVHDKIFEKCEQCSYKSVRKADLITHIECVHEKIRRFKCDKCAYQSSSKYGLSKHIKTYHEKYFEFKCEQCTYVTVRRSDLTRHLKRPKTEVFEENEKIDNEKILLKSSQNYQDNCAEAKCCDVEYKHICRCCSHHAEEEGKFTLKDLKKHLKKEHILTYNDYVNYILVHF